MSRSQARRITELERELADARRTIARLSRSIERYETNARADVADLTELRCALAKQVGHIDVESDPAGEIARPFPLVRPPATGAPIDPVHLPQMPMPGWRSA